MSEALKDVKTFIISVAIVIISAILGGTYYNVNEIGRAHV